LNKIKLPSDMISWWELVYIFLFMLPELAFCMCFLCSCGCLQTRCHLWNNPAEIAEAGCDLPH